MTRQFQVMFRIKAAAAALVVLGSFALGGQLAGASSPGPPPAPPRLSTSYNTVGLSGFSTSGTTCGQILTTGGQHLGYCQTWDGTARVRLPLDQRLKAAIRGTATLTVPDNTDSVSIGYGRQPSVEYSTRPTVLWPIPGSGTYDVRITLKSHDETTTTQTEYSVPFWVPRTT